MRRAQVLAFVAGFETFHALAHAYFGLSGRSFPSRVLGLRVTPTLHAASAVLHAGLRLLWGRERPGKRAPSRVHRNASRRATTELVRAQRV